MAASLNGFGTGFYGQRDFRPDGSYITTEWVILAYLPVAPIRSHRVIRNPSQDRNLLVYMSQGYVMVETLPCNGRQVWSVYGFFLLCFVWAFLTVYLLLTINSRWPDHEQLFFFAGVAFGGTLMLVPWYLRRRAQAAAPFSQEALAETIDRLVAAFQPRRATPPPPPPPPPPLRTTPPPLPPN